MESESELVKLRSLRDKEESPDTLLKYKTALINAIVDCIRNATANDEIDPEKKEEDCGIFDFVGYLFKPPMILSVSEIMVITDFVYFLRKSTSLSLKYIFHYISSKKIINHDEKNILLYYYNFISYIHPPPPKQNKPLKVDYRTVEIRRPETLILKPVSKPETLILKPVSKPETLIPKSESKPETLLPKPKPESKSETLLPKPKPESKPKTLIPKPKPESKKIKIE
jgi:hypothetical protein